MDRLAEHTRYGGIAATFDVAMHPVVFDGLTGWLHLPLAGRGDSVPDTGLILCNSLGREARSAHLPLRRLADRAAHAGYPTLRYDHPGQGEGLDLPPDDDAVQAWLDGVRRAVRQMRRRTGVSRVVVCGLRIGANIAAAASATADGLILLAPAAGSHVWLRQTRLNALLGGTLDERGGGMEADGLTLSAATLGGFPKLNAANWPQAPREVLLVAPDDDTAQAAAIWAAQGVFSRVAFEGFKELLKDSHSSVPPERTFERAVAWLTERFPSRMTLGAPYDPGPPARLEVDGVIEEPVVFGPGLRGVFTRPADGQWRGRGVLFLNPGADPRAGIGRFHVHAARDLAHLGMASLRFDFAGLGDSDWAPQVAPWRSHVYETRRQADIDEAVKFLSQKGIGEIVIMGVCAGAFHAIDAALEQPNVEAVFGVNPVRLTWAEGETIETAQREQGRATRQYLQRMRDPGVWARLLQGKVDVKTIALAVHSRLAKRLHSKPPRSRGSTATPAEHVRRFNARGGRFHMLLGLDDSSLDEVETHFGRRGRGLKALKGGSVSIIEGLDHGLARASSRGVAMDQFLRFVDQRPLPATGKIA